jgi:hypothetical protein
MQFRFELVDWLRRCCGASPATARVSAAKLRRRQSPSAIVPTTTYTVSDKEAHIGSVDIWPRTVVFWRTLWPRMPRVKVCGKCGLRKGMFE